MEQGEEINWNDLQGGLLEYVFSYVDPSMIPICSASCKTWRDVLQFSHFQKHSVPFRIEDFAALHSQKGHSQILEWLKETKCDWDERVVYHAAEGNHFELFKWLINDLDCVFNYIEVWRFVGRSGNMEWLSG